MGCNQSNATVIPNYKTNESSNKLKHKKTLNQQSNKNIKKINQNEDINNRYSIKNNPEENTKTKNQIIKNQEKLVKDYRNSALRSSKNKEKLIKKSKSKMNDLMVLYDARD